MTKTLWPDLRRTPDLLPKVWGFGWHILTIDYFRLRFRLSISTLAKIDEKRIRYAKGRVTTSSRTKLHS